MDSRSTKKQSSAYLAHSEGVGGVLVILCVPVSTCLTNGGAKEVVVLVGDWGWWGRGAGGRHFCLVLPSLPRSFTHSLTPVLMSLSIHESGFSGPEGGCGAGGEGGGGDGDGSDGDGSGGGGSWWALLVRGREGGGLRGRGGKD